MTKTNMHFSLRTKTKTKLKLTAKINIVSNNSKQSSVFVVTCLFPTLCYFQIQISTLFNFRIKYVPEVNCRGHAHQLTAEKETLSTS